MFEIIKVSLFIKALIIYISSKILPKFDCIILEIRWGDMSKVPRNSTICRLEENHMNKKFPNVIRIPESFETNIFSTTK